VLSLDSPRWSALHHAYGSAGDVPALLRRLAAHPSSSSDEPWRTLWSSLYHQGDIFPASFAAIPHIVDAIACDPPRAQFDHFLLPASVEVARIGNSVPVPAELEGPYLGAVARLPSLCATAATHKMDATLCQSALAAYAAATGNVTLARLLLEVEVGDLTEVLSWYENR